MFIQKTDVLLYLCPLYLEDKEVKDKFNKWYEASKVIQIRAITILTAFLYIIYSQVDKATAPSSVKSIVTLLHLYALPLSLFVISGLTFWGRYYRVVILLLVIAPVGAAVGSVFTINNSYEFTVYLPELYLLVIWVFAISGLRLLYASASALLVFLVAALSELPFQNNFMSMHLFWLISAFSFGLLSAFLIEKSNKMIFLNKQKLERLATIDGLTGLYNRLKIEGNVNEEVERAGRYKRSLSVILLDIDDFKNVNDNYGHNTGDVVLKEFSSILKDGVRKADAVGRWGGEEFLIILPETGLEEAKNVAEQIKSKIESHLFTVVKQKTSSFGISEYILGDNSRSMISRADKALYKAKEYGKNQIQTL
ncbi:MAG: GGDEF domain-containing protein [Pseudomonadota bacterium]